MQSTSGSRRSKNNFWPVYYGNGGRVYNSWYDGAQDATHRMDGKFFCGCVLVSQAVAFLRQLHASLGGDVPSYQILGVGFQLDLAFSAGAPVATASPQPTAPYRCPSWVCKLCTFSNRNMSAPVCYECEELRSPNVGEGGNGGGRAAGGGGCGSVGGSADGKMGSDGGVGCGGGGRGGAGGASGNRGGSPPGGPPGFYAAHPQPNPMSAGCESLIVSFRNASPDALHDALGVANSFTSNGPVRCEFDGYTQEFRLFGPPEVVRSVGERLHECLSASRGSSSQSSGHVSGGDSSSSDSSSGDGGHGNDDDLASFTVACANCNRSLGHLGFCRLVRLNKPLTAPLRRVNATVATRGVYGTHGLADAICQACQYKVGSIDHQNVVLFKLGRRVSVTNAAGRVLSVADIALVEQGLPLEPVPAQQTAQQELLAANAIGALLERAARNSSVVLLKPLFKQGETDLAWTASVQVLFSGSPQVFTASSSSKSQAHQGACRLALAAFDTFAAGGNLRRQLPYDGVTQPSTARTSAPSTSAEQLSAGAARARLNEWCQQVGGIAFSWGASHQSGLAHSAEWGTQVSAHQIHPSGEVSKVSIAVGHGGGLSLSAAKDEAAAQLLSSLQQWRREHPQWSAQPPEEQFHEAAQLRGQLRQEHRDAGGRGGWGYDAQAELDDQERVRQAQALERLEREAVLEAQNARAKASLVERTRLQAQVDALEQEARERAALRQHQAVAQRRQNLDDLDQEGLLSAEKQAAEVARAERRVAHHNQLRLLQEAEEAAASRGAAASPGISLPIVTPSSAGAGRRTWAPPPSSAAPAPAHGAAPYTAAAQPIAPPVMGAAAPPPPPPPAAPSDLQTLRRLACDAFVGLDVRSDEMWRTICSHIVDEAGAAPTVLAVLLCIPANARTPSDGSTPPRSSADSAPPLASPGGYADVSDHESDQEPRGQQFYNGSGRGRRDPSPARARTIAERDPDRPRLPAPHTLTPTQESLFNLKNGDAHGLEIRDEEDAAQALGGKPGCAAAYRARSAMTITPGDLHYANFIDPVLHLVVPEGSTTSSPATRAAYVAAGNAMRVDGIEYCLSESDLTRLDVAAEKNPSADRSVSSLVAARDKMFRGDNLRKKEHLLRLAGLKEWDQHGQVVIDMLTGAADEVLRRQKGDCRTPDFYWLCLEDIRLFFNALAQRVAGEGSLFEYRLSALPFVRFAFEHLHDLYKLFDRNQHGLAFIRASQYCRHCVHDLDTPFALLEFQQHTSNARAAAQCQHALNVSLGTASALVPLEGLHYRPDPQLLRNLASLQTLRDQVGEAPKAAMAACIAHAEAFCLRQTYRHPTLAERAKRDAKRGSALSAADDAALFRRVFVETLAGAGIPAVEADRLADKHRLDRKVGSDETKAACVSACKKFYDSFVAANRD